MGLLGGAARRSSWKQCGSSFDWLACVSLGTRQRLEHVAIQDEGIVTAMINIAKVRGHDSLALRLDESDVLGGRE